MSAGLKDTGERNPHLSTIETEAVAWVRDLNQATSSELQAANSDFGLRQRLHESARRIAESAYQDGDWTALRSCHQLLALIYEIDLGPVSAAHTDCETQPILRDLAAVLEGAMIDYESQLIGPISLPYFDNGAAFVNHLKGIVKVHPAGRHPFYTDFLPDRASVEDIQFYLAQETALDPRFDDLIALMQIGASSQPKMELATNYWDEMGNGNPAACHTLMFSRAMAEVGVDADFIRDHLLVEALICGNLSACLSLSRRHYYRAVGHFAVTEFLFPRRCAQFASAWSRNGLSATGSRYHREHIAIDARHASGFFRNVISPAVDADPRVAKDIVWGALARLNSSQRYLDALLPHLDGASDSCVSSEVAR